MGSQLGEGKTLARRGHEMRKGGVHEGEAEGARALRHNVRGVPSVEFALDHLGGGQSEPGVAQAYARGGRPPEK